MGDSKDWHLIISICWSGITLDLELQVRKVNPVSWFYIYTLVAKMVWGRDYDLKWICCDSSSYAIFSHWCTPFRIWVMGLFTVSCRVYSVHVFTVIRYWLVNMDTLVDHEITCSCLNAAIKITRCGCRMDKKKKSICDFSLLNCCRTGWYVELASLINFIMLSTTIYWCSCSLHYPDNKLDACTLSGLRMCTSCHKLYCIKSSLICMPMTYCTFGADVAAHNIAIWFILSVKLSLFLWL